MKIIYPVDLVDPVILSKIYHFTHTIRYRADKMIHKKTLNRAPLIGIFIKKT